MRLYLAERSGKPGTVFHLRPGCGAGLRGLDPEEAAYFRKTLGIRRICLRCKKAERKAVEP